MQSHPSLLRCRVLHVALLGLLLHAHARAADQTATWNSTTGDWSDATRWSTNPLFPNNGNGGLSFDATVAGGTVSLDVLTEIEGLNMTGGTISGTQPLTVNGPFVRTNGIFTGSGLITFAGTSTSNVAGTFTALGSGVTMINAGDMTVTAASNDNGLKLIRLGGSGGVQPHFTNTGTLRLQGTADILADGNGGGTFINNGTIIKEGVPGEESYVASNHVFTNNGAVQVNGGRMSFNGSTHAGAVQVAAGATLLFEGNNAINAGASITGGGVFQIGRDTTTVNTPLNIGPRLDLVPTTFSGSFVANAAASLDGGLVFNGFSHTITGPGDVTFNGPVDWQRGNMSGTGQTIIAAGVTANLTTATGKVISQRPTTNHGTINVSGARFDLRQNAVLNNHGAINLLDEAADMATNGEGANNTLSNLGTFTKSGAGTVSEISSMTFNNAGLVQVSSGTLQIGGNATPNNFDGGSFEVASGATLHFPALGVTHVSTVTTIFTGEGLLLLSSGTTQWAGTTIELPVTLTGGTFTTLAGGVTFARDLSWTGGTISGTGGVTIQPGVTADLSGAGKVVNANTIENHGTINVSQARFDLRQNAVLNNHGTMNLLDEAADMFTNSEGVNNTLNNTGLMTKSGAGTTTTIGLNNVNNAGTVRVDEGMLTFTSTFTQTAGELVLNGGAVTKNTGALLINGGHVRGGGTITSAVAVSGATLAPGIGAAPGALAITSDLTLTSASKLSIDIGGTTPGTEHDQITEAGSTALNLNGCTLELGHLGGYLGGTVTILSSSAPITGAFGNVAHNQRIKTKDGKGTFRVSYPTGSFSVQLNSFQAAPFDLTLAGDATVTENLALGTVVGTLSASSVKANPFLEFTLVSGAGSGGNASFRIIGNQLEVQTPLDFENGGASRSVRVRVTDLDNGESIEGVFAITVLDVPSPTSLAVSNASVVENLPAGTVVGDLSALPAGQASFTFALVSGAGSGDNALFSVDGGTLKLAASLDFEAQPTRSVRVRVTNAGGETLEQAFTITVEDVPAPVDLALNGSSVAENLPAETLVGTLSATDVTDLTYSLVSGAGAANNALFQITGNELRTAAPLDFEAIPNPSIRVRATNEGGETLEEAFAITVIDQGITALSLAPQSVKENLPAGTVAGTFSSTVAPAGTDVTYAFVSGAGSADNALFAVDGDTLKTAAVLDEEASASRSVRVRGTDAKGEIFEVAFTIAIEDNDPNIVITNHSGVAVPASGSPVHLGLGLLSPEKLSRTFTIQNTGIAPLQNLSASLTGGDVALFTLVPASLPASLSPGSAITLTVNYSPPDEGVHTTTLRILSSDPDTPTFDIPLTAQGVTPIQIAQMAYVKDTEPASAGLFGSKVAVDGNTVVIGTNGTQGVSPHSFTVLTFDPVISDWSVERDVIDFPVYSVAVSANTIAVGQATGNNAKGRVSVYVRSGITWTLEQHLNAPAAANQGDNFGAAVALDGDRLIVGALFEDSSATGVNGDQSNNTSTDSGAAYIYQRTGSNWALDAYLKASNTQNGDRFGSSVSISGTTAIVGAPDAGEVDSGAVYVYTRDAGGWMQQNELRAPDAAQGDSFGLSVGISGDTVVVGTPSEDGKGRGVDGNQLVKGLLNSGAAYVFVRNGGIWTHQAYLKATNSDASDNFGNSVGIFGDTVAVGAFNEDSRAMGINGQQTDNSASNSGAAYLFRRTNGLWVQHAYLKAGNTGAGDGFGSAVAVSGNRLVMGAPFEDSASPGINGDGSNNDLSNAGAAYIFDIIPPEVIVHNGPDTSSPRLVDLQEDVVAFGATPLSIPVTRAFTIVNSSGGPLNVTGIQVPAFQFTVVGMPSSPIAPFAAATFFVRATAVLSGLHEGTVAISTDHTDPVFEFPISVNVVAGAPGTLDPEFGSLGTGVATISSGPFSSDRAFAMALQPDGRIVVAGVSGADSILVAQLTSDGRPDPTFNGGRPATRFLETETEGFGGMAVTVHEGKIVVAASSGWQGFGGGPEASGSQRHAVLRFNGNGTLDTSFGTNGIYFGDAAASAVETVRGVEATSSGKLIVVGRAGNDAFASRINQNGTLDTSFGVQGYVRLRSSLFGVAGWNTSTSADTVVILPDQSIVVGGQESRRELSTGTNFDFASLWKLSANGQLLGNESRERLAIDPFFSAGSFCSMSDMVLTPDGRIAAAGRVSTQSLPLSAEGRGVFHARFDTNLIPDVSYAGSNRTGYLPAGSSQSSFHAMGIAVQPNLKALIVGYEGGGSPSPSQATFVQRFLQSGGADLTYGQSGRAIVNLPNSRAYAAAMTANGDLLVAGHTLDPKIFLLRLHGDEKVPEIAVRNGSRASEPEITDNQAQGISFGSPRIGLEVQKAFLIQNRGTAPLDLDTITVPVSFRIVSRPGSVPPDSSQLLVLEFSNSTVGNYSGEVVITSNDTDEGQFTFPVFGTVQVNSPPVFNGFVATAIQGEKALISLAKILSRVTDANADIVQVTGFSAVSSFGGTISEELNDVLVYVPHPSFSGQDQFSITFSDGESEIVGVVSVEVEPDPAFNPKNPPKLEFKSGGNLEVQFTGIPKRQYIIERSVNLVDWEPIGEVISDDIGRVVFSDPAPPQPSAFYRITNL